MKRIFLLLVLAGSAMTAMGQNTTETFANKDNVIKLGFGLGGVYGFSNYDNQTPVFGASYERGIYEFDFGGVIGVGGFMGYKGYVARYAGPYDEYRIRSAIFILGARGTFHYDVFKVENLDTYGAAMITYHIVNESDNIPDIYDPYVNYSHSNATYASLHAGAQYYFTPSFGAYAEVGYGVYWLGMGVNFKF